jgi:catechol 2,3-dioxygenase-like lactoylglutathione lyase family enzyme
MTQTATRIEFQGLDHVALGCTDMQRTVDFYHGILGMPILHTLEYFEDDGSGNKVPMGQHFFFGVGGENPNAHLAFFYWKGGYHETAANISPEPRPANVHPRAIKPGILSHLNLRVAHEHIPAACEVLANAGIDFTHTTRYANPWREITSTNKYVPPLEACLMDSVYFDDPDGLHLEFNAWLPEWDSFPSDVAPWSDPRTVR